MIALKNGRIPATSTEAPVRRTAASPRRAARGQPVEQPPPPESAPDQPGERPAPAADPGPEPAPALVANTAARTLSRHRGRSDPPPWAQLRCVEFELTLEALSGSIRGYSAEVRQKATTIDVFEGWLEELGASAPLERLLAAQLLWCHARVARMCESAARVAAVDTERAAALDAAADRAMRTSAALARTIRDMRSGPAPSASNEQGSGGGQR